MIAALNAAALMAAMSSDVAVVVGIEDYATLEDVPGAAAGARAWEKLLLHPERRGVPPERVLTLYDRAATARAIEGALQDASELSELSEMSESARGGTLFVVVVGRALAVPVPPSATEARPPLRELAIVGADGLPVPLATVHALLRKGRQQRTVIIIDAAARYVTPAALPAPPAAHGEVAPSTTLVFSTSFANDASAAFAPPSFARVLLNAIERGPSAPPAPGAGTATMVPMGEAFDAALAAFDRVTKWRDVHPHTTPIMPARPTLIGDRDVGLAVRPAATPEPLLHQGGCDPVLDFDCAQRAQRERMEGARSKSDILAIVKAGSEGIYACARRAKQSGTLRLKWTITADGSVRDVVVENASELAPGVAACAMRVAAQWKFPRGRDDETVRMPIQLRD
jgi:hypothetical protein